MRRLTFVALLILLPGTALSLSFSVPLPDLVGVVDFSTLEGKEASFDVGQQFSEIENVWIEIEARVLAEQFDVCGTFFDPQPCVHEVQVLGFVAQMDTEGFPIFSTVHSDGLSFGNLRDLEGSGTGIAPFNDQFVNSDFQFLLDGEGSLTLFWNVLFGDPDRIILNYMEPSGEIFNARLIIDGTPIPEPSTALLVAAGLLVLARTRAKRPLP